VCWHRQGLTTHDVIVFVVGLWEGGGVSVQNTKAGTTLMNWRCIRVWPYIIL
jgi:hypothetical protein